MAKDEKVTPVTEEEIDNIRVTLDLDDGSVECRILTIFEADNQDYIALIPLDDKGNENADGEVYLYRYFEDEEGLPSIENIDSEEEYEIAADKFDEILDDEMFDEMKRNHYFGYFFSYLTFVSFTNLDIAVFLSLMDLTE